MELLLDDKVGNVWDLTSIVSDIEWKTSRIGQPGSLTVTLVRKGIYQAGDFQCNNGDIVRFRAGGANLFYGYIFKISEGNDDVVKLVCYDQIRYLMFNETYVFADVTASDVVRRIAGDRQLKLGRIDETGYRIPTMIEDNQKLLDIVCKALTLTLVHAGRNFFLYDDFGALSVRDSESMVLDFGIGDRSLMYGYGMERSIDSDTYNMIKLYRDNKQTGRRDVYMAQDSASMARWGMLQLTQSVDENANEAQINEQLNMLIERKNRETRSFKIEAIGDVRVRAGCYVPVIVGERGIHQRFLVDTCTHRFAGGDHTMSLELVVL